MTDEELAATRALLYDEEAGDPTENLTSEWASVRYNAEVRLAARALLDEVGRLRAHVAELEADVERRRQALEYANDRIHRRDEQIAALRTEVERLKEDIRWLFADKCGEPYMASELGETEHTWTWEGYENRYVTNYDLDEPGYLKLRRVKCATCGQTWTHP